MNEVHEEALPSRQDYAPPDDHSHVLRGYLFITFATICWGASASLGKAALSGKIPVLSGTHIDPLILAQMRTTLSLLILAPAVYFLRSPDAFSMPTRDRIHAMLLGVLGLVPSNFFYYYAIEKTSVATAIILQYTAPIWVLTYMVVRGKQRATVARVGAVIMALMGIAMAIGALTMNAEPMFIHFIGIKVNLLGLGAAQLAGISFATYNIMGQSLVARLDRWKLLCHALFGAAAFWMLINPPWKIYAAHYSAAQWIFLFIFAVSSMLLPFSLYFTGLRHLDATRAIVTSCLEPVFAILCAWLFVHEMVSAPQVIGMAVVLVATIIVQWPERQGVVA